MSAHGNRLRSACRFGRAGTAGFNHRSPLHVERIPRSTLVGRPVVGVCNRSGEPEETEPLGLLSGWVGGW